MKKILFIICFICSSATMMGVQTDTTGRSVSGEEGSFYRDSVWIVSGKRGLGPLFNKWKFDFVLDIRRTFISDVPARLIGFRFGMEYRRVHRFGFGVYDLGTGVQTFTLDELGVPIEEAVVRLNYASLFYERVLYFDRKWEWSATAHIGSGSITGNYRMEQDSVWHPIPERRVRPVEISTTGYYNLTWWCSLGAGVGYRYVRDLEPEIRPVYNAPVAIARVRIKLGKLVKSIWDRDTKYEY